MTAHSGLYRSFLNSRICLAFSSLSLQLPRHLACTRKPICASESAARIEAQVAREETERGDVAPRRELCQHRPAVAILYSPGAYKFGNFIRPSLQHSFCHTRMLATFDRKASPRYTCIKVSKSPCDQTWPKGKLKNLSKGACEK